MKEAVIGVLVTLAAMAALVGLLVLAGIPPPNAMMMVGMPLLVALCVALYIALDKKP